MSPKRPTFVTRAQNLYSTLASHRFDIPFILLLLLFESILCTAIITKISYTEIDWEAYMQEVDTWWLQNEYDYRKIRGSTGPLVYPAGFLYLYRILQVYTTNGEDIYHAQVIFCFLYILMTGLMLVIYTQVMRSWLDASSSLSQQQRAIMVWSWRIAMACCCLSKRIHSIFVLRLFNDGPAMLLLYCSVLIFIQNKWRLGCVVYSLAVSIKMNILLFAPGLLLLLFQFPSNITETVVCLAICAVVQLVVGAPFLLRYPESYIRKAFEFDRVFFYKWTVNWKSLSEDVFVSKQLSILLLLLHLATLALLAVKWLCGTKLQTGRYVLLDAKLTPQYICYTLAVCNFVGVAFARTLHYQFYVWYFHTLPLLLWMSNMYPLLLRIVLLAMAEYSFNVYPATPTSSAVLQLAHFAVLLGFLLQPPQAIDGMDIVTGESQRHTTSMEGDKAKTS